MQHSLRTPEELADYRCEDPRIYDRDHNVGSMAHRQRLIQRWGIPPGASVLDIGCGQANFTLVLADAVGPTGHVVGVDPAPMTYGTPLLSEAHPHVLASPVGKQIELVTSDIIEYLETTTKVFEYVVLGHCIWFFGDPSLLPKMLKVIASKQSQAQLLISEFAMVASVPEAVPHVLTAIAVDAIESFNPERSWRNICCSLTPQQIEKIVIESGYEIKDHALFPPMDGQKEGEREVYMLTRAGSRFVDDINTMQATPMAKTMLMGMVDAVRASLEHVEGGREGVRNMDVWSVRCQLQVKAQ